MKDNSKDNVLETTERVQSPVTLGVNGVATQILGSDPSNNDPSANPDPDEPSANFKKVPDDSVLDVSSDAADGVATLQGQFGFEDASPRIAANMQTETVITIPGVNQFPKPARRKTFASYVADASSYDPKKGVIDASDALRLGALGAGLKSSTYVKAVSSIDASANEFLEW